MKTLYTRRLKFKGDALSLFNRIKQAKHAFFLDSSLPGQRSSFSYLGFNPVDIIKGHQLADVKKACRPWWINTSKLAFPAGAVGCLGYDGSLWFGIYDGLIAVDHKQGGIVISAFSRRRLDELAAVIDSPPVITIVDPCPLRQLTFKSDMTQAQYVAAVRAALKHIDAGDMYQINLSRRLELKVKGWQRYADAAAIYEQLRHCSPSSFGAYLDMGSQQVLSASPERFVHMRGRHVQVSPMKGTRPRGKDRGADARFKRDLLQDPKEKAELLMVTDLERNDLGRVCDYGSVKVRAMRTIEAYKTVFQATSTVEGRLHCKFDQFDLLKHIFPSGSVTGCPKIAAMRMIDELEKGSRGLYTGALGYISFTGDMDFNVMIRTLFLSRDKIRFHVGSGIVADSDPMAEYQETCLKAKAMEEALRGAFVT